LDKRTFYKEASPLQNKKQNHEAGKEFMNTDDIGGHGLSSIVPP